ncbi:MAG: hypothetical protein ACRCST_16825, partial [Turicibacter sp.]
LPGRRAFCMRDVAHHSGGAHVLGLQAHTKNMLKKFAENISESKMWCSYWEIDSDNKPAPVDYKTDKDFWYNLPANFDVMECCYRQYLWTGDRDYIEDPIFKNFYEKTVNEYVECWDSNHDGLLEYKEGLPSYMGIPTYLEDYVGKLKIVTGVDLLALQYGAYNAYAEILKLAHDRHHSNVYKEKAKKLKEIFNSSWWSEENKNYYSIQLLNEEFKGVSSKSTQRDWKLLTPVPLLFDLANSTERVEQAIDTLLHYDNRVIELESYYPEVLFKHRYCNEAFEYIKDLCHEKKARREYPEVSYNVVYAIVDGMIGLKPQGETHAIETYVQMPEDIEWLEVDDIPVFDGELDISVVKEKEIEITNHCSGKIQWTCLLDETIKHVEVNNKPVSIAEQVQKGHVTFGAIRVSIEPNESCIIKYN